jgi:hypothetical protein
MTPYQFTGRVIACSEPYLDDNDQCAFDITLQSLRGGPQLRTLPFEDEEMYLSALYALEHGLYVHVKSILIIPEQKEKTKRTPVLALVELRDVRSQTELLGSPPEVIKTADRFIEEHEKKKDGILEELTRAGYDYFGGVYTSRSDRTLQCERAVTLQALSAGQVGPTVNPRISMAIVSRQGAGKKMMSNLGLLYAPLGQMVQPTMLSLAGLGASVRMKGGGYYSVRGIFPNCHLGFVGLEDEHRTSRRIVNDVHGALLGVIEDGVTVMTKAATAQFAAQTAVHMNLNRQSVINARLPGPGLRGKLKDLGIPVDLLTRIDLLIELAFGDNPTEQAQDMVAQFIPADTPERRKEKADKELLIKTIIARLIDRNLEVSFAGYEDKLRALVGDISILLSHFSSRMSEEHQQLFDADGLLRRMANSIRKLVSASARLSNRSQINDEDIEVVWDLLSFKLEFVRWICEPDAKRVRTLSSRQEAVAEAQKVATARWIEIIQRFGGQRVTLVEMAEQLGLNVRTVGRYLEEHGYYPEFGACRIPTLAEETERVMKREPKPEPPPEYTEEHHHVPEGQTVEQAKAEPQSPPPPVLLDPLTPDLHRAVLALRTPELTEQQDMMIYYLLEAGFDYDRSKYGTCTRMSVVKMKLLDVLAHTPDNIQVAIAVRDRMMVESGVERGRLALQLIHYAGWDVPTYPYRALLARDDVPAELKPAIESILAREVWENEEKEKQQKREEEEARRIESARIFV